jgi:predicted DNA-binding protein YlxM (UPF0122 family)
MKWIEEDIKFLKDNYKTMNASLIAEKLNRSVKSVYIKANRLKLDNKVKKSIDLDLVVKMYLNDNKSLKEIAEFFGVSFKYISNLLPDDVRKKNRYRLLLSKETLIELYFNQKLSLKEIGNKFDFDASTVLRIMKEYNLDTRNSYETNFKDLNNKTIVDLYNSGLSCIEIADKLNTSHTTISNRLKEFGINLREHSFYVSGEKSNTWKGGITPENKKQRESSDYKKWRLEVFTRDNFTCQACLDNSGGNLHSHHIENFSDNIEKRLDGENGVTLCENCHSPNVEGSFHNTYGTHNNNREQLEEYIKSKQLVLI